MRWTRFATTIGRVRPSAGALRTAGRRVAVALIASVALLGPIFLAFGCGGDEPEDLVLPAGTELIVALQEPLSSGFSRIGEEFSARLVEAIEIADGIVLPAGSATRGRVLEVVPSRAAADRGARMTLILHTVRDGSENSTMHELRTLPLRLITLGPTERAEVLPTTGGPTQRLTIKDVLSAPTGESLRLPAEAEEIVLRTGQRMRFLVIGDQSLEGIGKEAASAETSATK